MGLNKAVPLRKTATTLLEVWPRWSCLAIFLGAGGAMAIRAVEGLVLLTPRLEISRPAIAVLVLCPSVIAGAIFGVALAILAIGGGGIRAVMPATTGFLIRLAVFLVPLVVTLQVVALGTQSSRMNWMATLLLGSLVALVPAAAISFAALMMHFPRARWRRAGQADAGTGRRVVQARAARR